MGPEIEAFIAWVKSAAPAEPHSEILLPGEVERRTKAQRQKNGIPLDAATLDGIRMSASRLGIDTSRLKS